MEKLEAITRLSKNVVRVLAQNPGKFTLQGTNTYLVGERNPYVLIDVGEGKDEYIPILESALRNVSPPHNPSEVDVSDIILSHWHQDHVNGLPSVLALLRRLWEQRNPNSSKPFAPPRLHKFPLPASGLHTENPWYQLPSVLSSLLPNSFAAAPGGGPLHDLRDGQVLSTVRIVHTPGHTPDSVCIYIPEDKALYTADSVLGQGTAVFEDLGDYLESLQKMLDLDKDAQGENAYSIVYPGHGPVLTNGKETIQMYINHRLEREGQIVTLLKSPPSVSGDDHWSTWSLVSSIYASYPENLWLPASRSIDLHLQKLVRDGTIRRVGGEGVNTTWKAV